ncbi:hypothetical protein Tco_1105643 [Tanacetum coccineum]
MAHPAEFNAKNNRLNKKKGNKRLEPKDDFKFMCNRTGCGYGFNHFHDLQAHKANCKKNLSNKQVADNAALQQPGPAAVQVEAHPPLHYLYDIGAGAGVSGLVDLVERATLLEDNVYL